MLLRDLCADGETLFAQHCGVIRAVEHQNDCLAGERLSCTFEILQATTRLFSVASPERVE